MCMASASTRTQLVCPLCTHGSAIQFTQLSRWLTHIKLIHSHQPAFNITCGIGGCQRTFGKFRSFENHVSALHRHQQLVSNADTMEETNDEGNDEGDSSEVALHDHDITADDHGSTSCSGAVDGVVSSSSLQRSSALFLLGLKEKHKLTQGSMTNVVEGVTTLTQQRIEAMQTKVYETLSSSGISPSSIQGLDEIFRVDAEYSRPFIGLESQQQQLSYYRQHFHLIEPERVLLGERHVWKGTGAKRRYTTKEDHFFYIPILQTIQCLLRNESVVAEVEKGHFSRSDYMEDYCDGKAFRSHPLFSANPCGLQIFFYYDELEVCNPLGSKIKTHKLGIFYFTLGNIPPRHRSRLSSIQLVAIVKTTNISTYGMDAVLQPFIDDMKKLETGYPFVVDGNPKVYYGTVSVVSADNLGSLAVGGFKESCSAKRMCRHCMATKETAGEKFHDHLFTLRSKQEHQQHCADIKADPSGKASTEHGVNRDSILNQLKYFHVCDGSLLPDIMHDILEGLLQYEMKLMLLHMVDVCKYFTLEFLNSRMVNLELGYMECKDRPTAITTKTLHSSGGSLKQKAAQMFLLGRILPLLIADKVPDDDEHWENFLLLMEIVNHLFSPVVTEDQAAYVEALIAEHHTNFVHLYRGSTVTPKMHFIVHMPRLMILYGPLIRHWTMRFEAKHAYFKGLAHSLGNFINLPYSLAMRHQLLQCYYNIDANELPGSQHEVGPGSVVPLSILQGELELEVHSIFETNWVKVNNVDYRKGAGLVLEMEHECPKVGKILTTYVVNSCLIYFRVSPYITKYMPHYRSYTLQKTSQADIIINITALPDYHPLFIRSSQAIPHNQFIVLPHYIHDKNY